MLNCFETKKTATLPIIPILIEDYANTLKTLPKAEQTWLTALNLTAEAGAFAFITAGDGTIAKIYVIVDKQDHFTSWASLPDRLPHNHVYHIEDTFSVLKQINMTEIIYAWGCGGYRFYRYKSEENNHKPVAKLFIKDIKNTNEIIDFLTLVYQIRDWVSTPTNDLGPTEFAHIAKDLATQLGAKIKIFKGEELLKHNYPTVYAVGKAASNPPHYVDISWGKPEHKQLILIGKGVCFDTGGLDLKPASAMQLMKKDMGGAAHALAFGMFLIKQKLPLQIRILLPLVENSVAGNAMRPLDIIKTRKDITVEIGNTDAEGRLILADALAHASELEPSLMIDFATLTGAARVALGTDLPAFFTNCTYMRDLVIKHTERERDPVWHMPLYQPYKKLLRSNIADINNIWNGPYGGCILASLFLQEFVKPNIPWIHLDLFAYNSYSRPGKPEGGEMMTLKGLYAAIKEHFVD